jgi:hypothetical protein
MDVRGTNLVCVVKRVVHEPSDYARLPDGLIAQKYELILGQWIGARHLRVATFFGPLLLVFFAQHKRKFCRKEKPQAIIPENSL